jgi:hypothetical protein
MQLQRRWRCFGMERLELVLLDQRDPQPHLSVRALE